MSLLMSGVHSKDVVKQKKKTRLLQWFYLQLYFKKFEKYFIIMP